jgi:phosphoglycerate dehydrogenase-like enzyme
MRFTVGLARDLLIEDGRFLLEPNALAALEDDGIGWAVLDDDGFRPTARDAQAHDAVIVLDATLAQEALRSERLALLACPAVTLNGLDLDLCTDHGVAVTVTTGGVRRPLAAAAVAFLHALAFRLLERDRAAREDGWPARFSAIGLGLAGRTLGVVASAATARELSKLVEPLGLRLIAYDPWARPAAAAAVAADAVALDELLRESDFVCVACPCDDRTRHLLDGRRLACMRPTASVIVVGEGGVVDETALAAAVSGGRLAGAALDVFEREPLPRDHPLLAVDRVLLSPHALAHVRQSFAHCVADIRAVAAGASPAHVANPEVLCRPEFAAKLRRYAS